MHEDLFLTVSGLSPLERSQSKPDIASKRDNLAPKLPCDGRDQKVAEHLRLLGFRVIDPHCQHRMYVADPLDGAIIVDSIAYLSLGSRSIENGSP